MSDRTKNPETGEFGILFNHYFKLNPGTRTYTILTPVAFCITWHVTRKKISFRIDNTTVPFRISNIYLLRFKIGCYGIPDYLP